jgi:hypothetical protein
MATKEHVYGEIDNAGDLKRIFAQIRSDVAMATSREDLTDLYRHAPAIRLSCDADLFPGLGGAGSQTTYTRTPLLVVRVLREEPNARLAPEVRCFCADVQ